MKAGKLLITCIFIVATLMLQAEWIPQNSGTTNNLKSVGFSRFNPDIGYVAGANSTVKKSDDGGELWLPVDYPGSIDANDMHVITSSYVIVAGDDGDLIRTVNGGDSWNTLDPQVDGRDINGMDFTVTGEGIIVADQARISITTNTGISWEKVDLNLIVQDIYDVDLYDKDVALAVGQNGLIIKTMNGGSNWTTKQSADELYNLNAIRMFNQDIAVAVGDNGVILKTTDGGDNWTTISSGTTNDLFDIQFNTDLLKLYAVGANGTILISHDRGDTWEPQLVNSIDDLHAVYFTSPIVGFAVGNNGTILKTTNSGNSVLHPIEIITPNANTVWTAGDTYKITWDYPIFNLMTIEFSSDGGVNWDYIASRINNEEEYDWTIPEGISSMNCLVRVSLLGIENYSVSETFRIRSPQITVISPNGGERWNQDQPKRIFFETTDVDFVKIEHTHDGGATWETVAQNIDASIGEYDSWNVSKTPSPDNFIRVSDMSSDLSDMSDDPFEIIGLNLTSMNNGNSYLTGEEIAITWESYEIETVNLYFSSDNGNSWSLIDENIDAELGEFLYTLPDQPFEECRIRIIDPQNTIFFDISENPFSTKGLKLVSPEGGEILISGTTELIIWENQGTNIAKLEYTTDDGANWITIESQIDATTGSYEWLVPKTASNTCRIRITDLENPSNFDTGEEFFTVDGNGLFVLRPDERTEIDYQSSYEINWISINIYRVDIEFSTDNGITWQEIDSNIPATHNQYTWDLSQFDINPSTECYIRLIDHNNSETVSTSEKFRISGDYFRAPVDWAFAHSTGSNAVLVVPSNIGNVINNSPLNNNDAIGFFYKDESVYKCGGFAHWQGSNLSITVWGDNQQTPEKDGFDFGEDFHCRVWDSEDGEEYRVSVSYASGPENFQNNGISIIDTMSNYKTLLINIPVGIWSIISSNIIPDNTNIESILSEIEPNIELVKNEDGEVYYPSESINTIGSWNMEHGYQIYVPEDPTNETGFIQLSITGEQVNPAEYPIRMTAGNWYITGYLSRAPSLPVATAVASLGNNVLMIKDSRGRIYYPNYGIDQINEMRQGQGYKFAIETSSATLTYPLNANVGGIPMPIPTEQKERKYTSIFENTGSSSVLVVKNQNFVENDEVAIIDESGNIVGTGIFENEELVITIWGDNEVTESVKEGAYQNERLSILYWSELDQREYQVEIKTLKDIMSNQEISSGLAYREDDILHAEIQTLTSVLDITDKISVYPNPARENVYLNTNNSEILNVEMIDIFGNLVYSSNDVNIRNINVEGLSTGTYFVKVTISSGVYTEKLVIGR